MRTLSEAAVWHDLECGRYTADLPSWRALAESHPGPILDVGAGTGRVALDLAGRGHDVTALDRAEELLAELARRAQGADVQLGTVLADARDFHLRQRFALVLAPMQTIQLLGPEGRAQFLSAAASHLSPGGRLAAAITERFDLYDSASEDAARLPSPDVHQMAGTVYVSQPTAVRLSGRTIILERRREARDPDGARRAELHREELDALSAPDLEREGVRAGLRPAGCMEIAATSDHVGSVVVMLDV